MKTTVLDKLFHTGTRRHVYLLWGMLMIAKTKQTKTNEKQSKYKNQEEINCGISIQGNTIPSKNELTTTTRIEWIEYTLKFTVLLLPI